MAKEYEAIEGFESPAHGAVAKGRLLVLDDIMGKAWTSAGLVREVKPKREPALKKEEANG